MVARVRSLFGIFLHFIRNISAVRKFGCIQNSECAGLVFRGYSQSDVRGVARIYEELNGTVFSMSQRTLYRCIGNRCLFVVEQIDVTGRSRIIAMNMYYLNRRDIQENTVHEGFIGVIPEFNGKGIATKMRRLAIEHFKAAGLSGISTRISLDNVASLVSAQKLGFVPSEEYLDAVTGVKRYYMVHKF